MSARKTSGNADEWAECYSGNVGGVVLSDMTATPSATDYPRVYPGPGQQHNGSSGGCYIQGVAFSAGVYAQTSHARIEGLRFEGVDDNGFAVLISASSHVQARSMLAIDTGACVTAHVAGAGVITGHTAINCIAMNCKFSFTSDVLFGTGTASCHLECDNCTAKSSADPEAIAFSPYAEAISGSATATMTCKNCVGVNSAEGDFLAFTGGMGGTETATLVNTSCASSDATADDFGGTANLINQDPDDLFVDAAGGDFQPKPNSALIHTGANLIADFTQDMVGHERPSVGVWDIGALQYVPPYVEYDISYTYDAVGNRLTKVDVHEGTTTYVYDRANQLTSETSPLGNHRG